MTAPLKPEFKMPVFLAIFLGMLPIFLATRLNAAQIQVAPVSPTSFEIRGTSPRTGEWHILYGTNRTASSVIKVLTLDGPGQVAYFSHGAWLRQVDVERGVVTGRWKFPGMTISKLLLEGNLLRVEIEDRGGHANQVYHREIVFDQDHPALPYWPSESALFASVPVVEVQPLMSFQPLPQTVEEAENTVRRDPLTPMLRLGLGRAYRLLGRNAAALEMYGEAVHSIHADFQDLLFVSAFLQDQEKQPDFAREAFERAYAGFWQSGNDPRMFFALFSRLVAYPVTPVPGDAGEIERLYRLAPWTNGADVAWDSYANYLAQNGDARNAEIWSLRAAEARRNSLSLMSDGLPSGLIYSFLAIFASTAAALTYLVALSFRYQPQRRIHAAADGGRRFFRLTFFNIEYWSRGERGSVAVFIVVWWLCAGLVTAWGLGTERISALNLAAASGQFGGPVTGAFFENQLTVSSGRTFLLAMAYQQDGQLEKAEQLYRSLPDIAQAWNNLCVLLKNTGQIDQAREAFERALALNPQLAEAQLNAGKGSQGFWTDAHERYQSGEAMLAPPSRDIMYRAFFGGSPWDLALQAWRGPFYSGLSIYRPKGIVPPGAVAVTLVPFSILLICALFAALLPHREVTEASPRYLRIVEMIVPGLAPEWRGWGSLVLVAWSFATIVTAIAVSPLKQIFFTRVSAMRWFGVPDVAGAELHVSPELYVWGLLLAALWLLNAALIWYRRSQSQSLHLGA